MLRSFLLVGYSVFLMYYFFDFLLTIVKGSLNNIGAITHIRQVEFKLSNIHIFICHYCATKNIIYFNVVYRVIVRSHFNFIIVRYDI